MLTFFDTAYEWVACVAGRATADRIMIYNLAARVRTTGARARIHALLIHASFVQSTL